MTATVIDALLVTLGLDAANFNKGQKQAVENVKKTMAAAKEQGDQEKKLAKEKSARDKDAEAHTKRLTDGFKRARNEALTFFTALAIGSGLKNFIADTVNSSAALGFMAPNLKMSTERLSAWQRAAERAGGSAEGMTATLKSSADEVARFKMGQAAESTQWFFRMGGSSDALRDGNTYLLARAKIVHDLYKVDPTKAALVSSQMGISDEQFNLIKQGPAAILALVAAQEKNSTVSAAGAQKALELRNRMLDLRDSLRSSSQALLISLMPVLERGIVWLQGFAEWIVANRKEILAWVEAAIKSIVEFAKILDKGAEAVGGWKTVLVALLALKILSFTASLIGMAAALGRVGAGLGLIGTVGAGALRILGPLGLLLHSGGLNEGEDAELEKARNYKGPANAGTTLSTRQKFLVAQLQKEGYTDEQAAGIAGSLMQESGLDPAAVNPTSGAAGIAQWLGPRKKQFTEKYGMTPDKAPFEQQVDFLKWELRNTEKRSGDLIRRATTADQAAQLHAWEYERPGVAEANIPRRTKNANEVLAGIRQANAMAAAAVPSGASVTAPAAPGGGNNSTVTSETNIAKIEVHTAATDANGIAQDIGPALKQYGLVSQANSGLN